MPTETRSELARQYVQAVAALLVHLGLLAVSRVEIHESMENFEGWDNLQELIAEVSGRTAHKIGIRCSPGNTDVAVTVNPGEPYERLLAVFWFGP